MTDFQLLASMPMVTLDNGMTLRFEAINPTTGAAVAGVTITDAILYVLSTQELTFGSAEDVTPPQFALEPLPP